MAERILPTTTFARAIGSPIETSLGRAERGGAATPGSIWLPRTVGSPKRSASDISIERAVLPRIEKPSSASSTRLPTNLPTSGARSGLGFGTACTSPGGTVVPEPARSSGETVSGRSARGAPRRAA
jgi:hypothetical protein